MQVRQVLAATNQPNHPQTIHKPVFYVTKNFSNNAKHVLNFQPFYSSITLTFSSEDKSQVEIEGKSHESKGILVNQAFLTPHLPPQFFWNSLSVKFGDKNKGRNKVVG